MILYICSLKKKMKAIVSIIMGSTSDMPVMKKAAEFLNDMEIPFEINARFSGTTAVRSHFGFNEPCMALQSYYYKEKLKQPVIKKGMAFRYHEEVFIDEKNIDNLEPGKIKGLVKKWF